MAAQKLFIVLSVLCLHKVSATIAELGSRFFSEFPLTHSASPYTVVFKKEIDKGCTGALISESFILTAAQCVDDTNLEIILGAYDTSRKEKQQVRQLVEDKDIIIHPKFDPRTLENDIALIKLPTKVTFNQFIQTVELDDGKRSFIDRDAYLTGLGTHILYPAENKISHETLAIISNTKCKKYRPLHVINEAKLCAFHESTWDHMGMFSCINDPGSPLVVREEQEEVLVGIVSSRKRRCNNVLPAIFTRVGSYKKWIDDVVDKARQEEIDDKEAADNSNKESFEGDGEGQNEVIKGESVDVDEDNDEGANKIVNEEKAEEIEENYEGQWWN